MESRVIEIDKKTEKYSDGFGNQILGVFKGNGKIVFSGENAKIVGGGTWAMVHV